MKKAGVEFVCRYLSNDSKKDLSPAEAQAASKAGISCVVVWESVADRALSGFDGGKADAQKALAKAKECGMPADRPIYFAVDFDATSGQQRTIDAYLSGAASVIGKSRVGVYGGYYVVRRCLDYGTAVWAWQTYAWSGGNWDSRAHIQQYRNGVKFDGADVDYNRSTKADFGQWKVGETPNMALSDADKKWILDNVPGAILTKGYNGRGFTPAKSLQFIHDGVSSLLDKAGQPIPPVDVDESAIVAGVLAGLNPEMLAEAIATDLGPDVAASVLDALRTRLES